MIAYGFIVDLSGLKGKKRREFEYFMEDSELELMTGYSVGGYEPEMAVIGRKIDGTNFLFGPTLLSKVNLTPFTADKMAVDNFDLKSIKEWEEGLKNTEPGIIIFDDTDD